MDKGKGLGFFAVIIVAVLVFASPLLLFLFGDTEGEDNQLGFFNAAGAALGLISEDDEDNIVQRYNDITGVSEEADNDIGMVGLQGILYVFMQVVGGLLILLLLFTPTKKISSPIMFLANSADQTYSKLSEGSADTDPEIYKKMLTQMGFYIVTLIVILASYKYIIDMIVSAVNNFNAVAIISSGITTVAVVFGTSLIVKKLEELDLKIKESGVTEDTEKKQYMYIGGLLVAVLVAFTLSYGINSQFNESYGETVNDFVQSGGFE